MNKSYVAIAAFAIAASLASCSKSDNNDSLPTNYKIDGIHDVTVQPLVNPNTYFSVNVSYVGTVQERVSLSLEGVPSGCDGNISVTGGYPTFASAISFSDTSALPGTYPIKLVCEGSKSGKKSYDFNLVIKPEPDFGVVYIGTYPNSSNSCVYNGHYTATVTASDKINKIYLNNFDNSGNTIYALVSANQYLTIPTQTVNGITYSGSSYSYYNGSGFSISLTESSTNGNNYCTMNFSK